MGGSGRPRLRLGSLRSSFCERALSGQALGALNRRRRRRRRRGEGMEGLSAFLAPRCRSRRTPPCKQGDTAVGCGASAAWAGAGHLGRAGRLGREANARRGRATGAGGDWLRSFVRPAASIVTGQRERRAAMEPVADRSKPPRASLGGWRHGVWCGLASRSRPRVTTRPEWPRQSGSRAQRPPECEGSDPWLGRRLSSLGTSRRFAASPDRAA